MADQLLNYFTSPIVMAAVAKMSTQKNALIQSGAVVNDASLASLLKGNSDTVKMAWNADLDYSVEPDAMNADPTDLATPSELAGEDSTVRTYSHHHSWLIANMVERMAIQSDPVAHLVSKLATYRMTWDQIYLLAMLKGIIEDNILNDSADMANIVYDDNAVPLAANKPSYPALLDTLQTAGDKQDMFRIMGCHSLTVTNLKKIDPDGFKTIETNVLGLPPVETYRKMVIIIDDDMTSEAGASSEAYYTYILGAGAIGKADAPLPKDTKVSAIVSNEAAGNGAGSTTHHYRWAAAQNAYGFDNLIASGTPLRLANLPLAASWDRKVARKLVPIGCLVHNN